MPRLLARDLALIAVFAALISALALPGAFTVPGMSVPITAQTLGVMLAGSLIGPWRGAAAMAVFLVLVAAGLPVLASGQSGLGVFTSPRGGYMAGFVAGALAIGLLVRAWRGRGVPLPWLVVANLVGGVLVVYCFGIPVTAAVADVPLTTAISSSWVFVPGDLLKVAIASVVAAGVFRGYPDLLPQRVRAAREKQAAGAA